MKIGEGANLDITSVDNGIKGNNSLTIAEGTGTITVNAGGDALKSDAIEVLTVDNTEYAVIEADKGVVEIKGGILTLNAEGGGIQADSLVSISGGTVNINSNAEGIKANEVNLYVYDGEALTVDAEGNQVYLSSDISISGGKVTIVSGEDGIKAAENIDISGTADITITATGTDPTEGTGYDAVQAGDSVDTVDGTTTTTTVTCTGNINISGGILNISGASDDAIVCKGSMTVTGGEIKGTSDCDFIKVYDNLTISEGNFEIECKGDGIQSGKALTETTSASGTTSSNYTLGNISITGGTFNIKTNGGSFTSLAEDADSCKGIKGNTEVVIGGGKFTINSADDALHSNYNLKVTDGTFDLNTGDDGLHADYTLTIGAEGGTDSQPYITIGTSYEGIEGSVINILSGTQFIYATDDGINGAGDYNEDGTLNDTASGSTGGGWRGSNQGADDTSPCGMVYVKGGKTYVEAQGDGFDSNGSINMSDGVVIINGPTGGGNGVFDIGDDGGSVFNITGGTLIGEGSSDMIVTPTVSGQGYAASGGSNGGMGGGRPGQGSTGSSGQAGSPVKVTTDSGSIVFVPKVNWGYMFITTDDMTSGKSYTIESISSYEDNGTVVLGITENNTFYGLIEY